MQEPPPAPPPRRRLDQVKLTPLVFVSFFAGLALMSGFAALVGYAAHRMSHPTAQTVKSP